MTTRVWVRNEIGAANANKLMWGGGTANLNRNAPFANLAALTTQVMLSTAIPLSKKQVVTSLTFVSATTAASVPTNWWFALYDTTNALVGQTADQGAAAWNANTAMTKNLTTAYTAPSTGVYYAAIMVKATTVPSLMGVAMLNAVTAGALGGGKVVSQTSGSALTTTAPATIATPTAVVNVPLVLIT